MVLPEGLYDNRSVSIGGFLLIESGHMNDIQKEKDCSCPIHQGIGTRAVLCFVVPPNFDAEGILSVPLKGGRPCVFGYILIRRLGRCPSRFPAWEASSQWPPSLTAEQPLLLLLHRQSTYIIIT